MSSRRKRKCAKSWHKWLGVSLSLFAMIFAISGIVLNHRALFSGIDVNRKWVPNYLKVENWSQSSLKTTIDIGSDSLLLYGTSGIWLTNTEHTFLERYEQGMKNGVENRNTAKIVKTREGILFAVTPFEIYRLDRDSHTWQTESALLDSRERFSDAATRGDTLVVMSRSAVFSSLYPYHQFSEAMFNAPNDYKGNVSLFRTIWRLHSGELFGVAGKIGVDLLGLATLLFSITGIILFFFPKQVKRLKRKGKRVSAYIATLRPAYKWHAKLGYWLAGFLLVL